jgi:hypothetical protein
MVHALNNILLDSMAPAVAPPHWLHYRTCRHCLAIAMACPAVSVLPAAGSMRWPQHPAPAPGPCHVPHAIRHGPGGALACQGPGSGPGAGHVCLHRCWTCVPAQVLDMCACTGNVLAVFHVLPFDLGLLRGGCGVACLKLAGLHTAVQGHGAAGSGEDLCPAPGALAPVPCQGHTQG